MKHFKIFLGVALAVIVGLASLISKAANPTVTTTEIATRASSLGIKGYQVIQYTFSTAIASADTAVIYFNTGGVSAAGLASNQAAKDSVIALTFRSSEATADSVRFTVWLEISGVASPSTNSHYNTVVTDATTFTNVTGGFLKFIPGRYGIWYRARMRIGENDTNKDATQTITVRAILPLS